MKTDIILSGVGGQGILSIAAVIGEHPQRGLYETGRSPRNEPERWWCTGPISSEW